MESFLEENLDRAYRLAYSYTKERASAEDVTSESIVKALSGIETLQKPEYLRSWFFRIVVNTAVTWLRREKRTVSLPESAEWEPSAPAAEDVSALAIEEFIELLDPIYKTVIILRFFEDLSLQEIADVTETNINTVKTRLYRGLKLLRIEMEEDYE